MQNSEIYVAGTHLQTDLKIDRASSISTTTESQSQSPFQFAIDSQFLTRRHNQRAYIFRNFKVSNKISSKVIEKAISWIQITGYTKNLDFETIILSIALFYASLNLVPITKKNLQPIVCACLLLSCKMTSGPGLGMVDILALIQNRQNCSIILENQKIILQALDYNLYFDFPVLQIINAQNRDYEQQEKTKLFIEALLIKDSTILFDIQKIEQIVELSYRKKLEPTSQQAIRIKNLLKRNACSHLLSKYHSKFDVVDFMSSDNFVCIQE